jgi:hypothetical protein
MLQKCRHRIKNDTSTLACNRALALPNISVTLPHCLPHISDAAAPWRSAAHRSPLPNMHAQPIAGSYTATYQVVCPATTSLLSYQPSPGEIMHTQHDLAQVQQPNQHAKPRVALCYSSPQRNELARQPFGFNCISPIQQGSSYSCCCART